MAAAGGESGGDDASLEFVGGTVTAINHLELEAGYSAILD